MKRLPLSGTGLCVCLHLRIAARAVTKLYDAALQSSGLRSTQFTLLTAIIKKEPVRISEIGSILAMDQTTLSRSLSSLKSLGYVSIALGSDRRERRISLTAKGRLALRKSIPAWRKIQNEVLSGLTEPDWRKMQKELQDLRVLSDRLSEAQSA